MGCVIEWNVLKFVKKRNPDFLDLLKKMLEIS
jgi:hypothetical protein